MGIASSSPAAEITPCDAAAVAERQRSFEFFESLDPGRSFRWVQHAWSMYRSVGGVELARPVFRAALARVADDRDSLYSAWTMMEAQEGFVVQARELYEEWRADNKEKEPSSSFWRMFMTFGQMLK